MQNSKESILNRTLQITEMQLQEAQQSVLNLARQIDRGINAIKEDETLTDGQKEKLIRILNGETIQ